MTLFRVVPFLVFPFILGVGCATSPYDVSSIDEKGRTPLFRAVEAGSIDDVKYHIAHGADVQEKDFRKISPLYVAAKSGNLEIVKLLVDAGADVNSRDYLKEGKFIGLTPLFGAIVLERIGNMAIVDFLITRGADPMPFSGDGWSALSNAICLAKSAKDKPLNFDRAEFIDSYLNVLQKHVNQDQIRSHLNSGNNTWTPLWCAVTSGDVGAVNALIKHGSELNVLTGQGAIKSPVLHYSANNANRLPMLSALLANGADPNLLARNDESGAEWTALHSAAQKGNLEGIRILLQHGADPNASGYLDVWGTKHSRWTPLHHAAAHGKDAARLALIDLGANPDAETSEGYTSAEIAQERIAQIKIAEEKRRIAEAEKQRIAAAERAKREADARAEEAAKRAEARARGESIWSAIGVFTTVLASEMGQHNAQRAWMPSIPSPSSNSDNNQTPTNSGSSKAQSNAQSGAQVGMAQSKSSGSSSVPGQTPARKAASNTGGNSGQVSSVASSNPPSSGPKLIKTLEAISVCTRPVGEFGQFRCSTPVSASITGSSKDSLKEYRTPEAMIASFRDSCPGQRRLSSTTHLVWGCGFGATNNSNSMDRSAGVDVRGRNNYYCHEKETSCRRTTP